MENRYENLRNAILSLKTKEECDALLNDLCTFKEIEELANRFNIALLLDQKNTFLDVGEKTGASSATICRVNRCLKNGTGYRTALDRISQGDHCQNENL